MLNLVSGSWILMSSSDLRIYEFCFNKYFSVEKESNFPYYSKLFFRSIWNSFSQFWGVEKDIIRNIWEKISGNGISIDSYCRDVSTGATGATVVAPKFWDTLTLLQPGGQILPTIAEVAPKFFLWLRPCLLCINIFTRQK